MNGALGPLWAHGDYTGPGEPPEDGEMNEMTFWPSTLPLGHSILNHYDWTGKTLFYFELEDQSGARTRDLRLFKQAALATAPGPWSSVEESDRLEYLTEHSYIVGHRSLSQYKAERESRILLCKVKRQYMFTLQVSRYCLLALHDRVEVIAVWK